MITNSDLRYFPTNPYRREAIFLPASPAQRQMIDATYHQHRPLFIYRFAYIRDLLRTTGLGKALMILPEALAAWVLWFIIAAMPQLPYAHAESINQAITKPATRDTKFPGKCNPTIPGSKCKQPSKTPRPTNAINFIQYRATWFRLPDGPLTDDDKRAGMLALCLTHEHDPDECDGLR